ncbi:uncharacterized protein LOC129871303 [Solanum dulcamara]|uniref:uncharacterized protein LOC129871303 n=1 Tax=Solanum dulcamara TaxID=45834 RepID=UPI002485D360|nr:uncharacterized protein LOC129871303 [Solanum dulcamara]
MNGAVEAANKNIKRILRKMIDNYKHWHKNLPFSLLGYRTIITNSTGETPYLLVYRTKAVLPMEVEIPFLRIIQEAELTDSNWIQSRYEQLMLIDKKRMNAVCHGQLYQQRMAKAFNKKIVKTRATIALEPAIGAIVRGGVGMRSRGRGCGRKPTKGKGQTTGPSREKAATPPPADVVAREAVEVDDEQVHEREEPPRPTPEMIHQVLTYLSGLSDQGQVPPSPNILGVQHVVVVAPFMTASSRTNMSTEFKDAYYFLVDCHKMLHKMDIVEQFGVEFMTFQFQGDTKICWRSHVKCQSAEAPPITWITFSDFFIEKYIPQTLRERRRDEFLNIEQGRMSVASYEDKIFSLDRYATHLYFSPEE